MPNRLHTVWLWSTLLCSCSLDSSARTDRATANDSQHDPASDRSSWQPPGPNNPIQPGGTNPPVKLDAGTAKPNNNNPTDAAQPASTTAPPNPDAGVTTTPGPAANSGVTPQADPSAAGSGGTTVTTSDVAGTSGTAGAESTSIRQMFIDAAIEALGGDPRDPRDPRDPTAGAGGSSEPWRRSGSTAGGLDPDFVLPVLLTMRDSAVCFRETRRCVEMCLVLATDCKPCASDPECGQALKDVCGPTIGNCGAP